MELTRGTLPLRLNDPEPTTQLAERCSNAPRKQERDALLNTQRYSTPPSLLARLLRTRLHHFRHQPTAALLCLDLYGCTLCSSLIY